MLFFNYADNKKMQQNFRMNETNKCIHVARAFVS